MELWVCVCVFFSFQKVLCFAVLSTFFRNCCGSVFSAPKNPHFRAMRQKNQPDRNVVKQHVTGVVQRSTMDVKKSEEKDTKESKAKDIKETKEGKESKDLKVTWAVLGGLIFYS